MLFDLRARHHSKIWDALKKMREKTRTLLLDEKEKITVSEIVGASHYVCNDFCLGNLVEL